LDRYEIIARVKAKKNTKAGRAMILGGTRRFGPKGAPLVREARGLKGIEPEEPRAIIKKRPDGRYNIETGSSTLSGVDESHVKCLLLAEEERVRARASANEPHGAVLYPRVTGFVKMEQGGLPSLGKKRR
jgi:hypothetical protein